MQRISLPQKSRSELGGSGEGQAVLDGAGIDNFMKWKAKHEKCKRGHLRTPDNLYAHGACKICSIEYAKAYAEGQDDPKAFRRKGWLAQYRVTPEQYERELASQENRCAACRRDLYFGPDYNLASPVVDHAHSCCNTGRQKCGKCNRGILCRRCNLVLGYLEGEPYLLPDYLVRYLNRRPLWIRAS